MSFAEAFIEIYSISAAFVLIFFTGQIFFMIRKVDRNLLKARLFLNENVIQKTWFYISIAGVAFALNLLIKFIITFTTIGKVLNGFYLAEQSQIIFLAAFICTVYNWHIFIHTLVSRS